MSNSTAVLSILALVFAVVRAVIIAWVVFAVLGNIAGWAFLFSATLAGIFLEVAKSDARK